MKHAMEDRGAARRDSGFSLIEVLIALAILTVGLLAIASQQITATRSNTVGGKLTTGSTLAQDKLEELVGLLYDDADLQDVDGDGAAGLTDIGANADYTENPAPVEQRGYRVFWNVAVEPSGVKRITVISQWGVAAASAGRTCVLSTMKPDV